MSFYHGGLIRRVSLPARVRELSVKYTGTYLHISKYRSLPPSLKNYVKNMRIMMMMLKGGKVYLLRYDGSVDVVVPFGFLEEGVLYARVNARFRENMIVSRSYNPKTGRHAGEFEIITANIPVVGLSVNGNLAQLPFHAVRCFMLSFNASTPNLFGEGCRIAEAIMSGAYRMGGSDEL